MNDQLNQSGQLSNSQDGARPIPEGMTVLRLGQCVRPSLATAGLLVLTSFLWVLQKQQEANRQEEMRWKDVPAWKRNIIAKKQERSATCNYHHNVPTHQAINISKLAKQ